MSENTLSGGSSLPIVPPGNIPEGFSGDPVTGPNSTEDSFAQTSEPAPGPDLAPEESAPPDDAPRRRRRRGKRGGRRHRRQGRREGQPTEPGSIDTTGPEEPAPPSALPSNASPGNGSRGDGARADRSRGQGAREDGRRRRRRKRGSRGGRRDQRERAPTAVDIEAIPGEEDDLPEIVDLPDEAVLIAGDSRDGGRGPGRDSRRRRRRGERGGPRREEDIDERDDEAEEKADDEESDEPAVRAAPTSPAKRRLILVNARDPEETRVAVVEDGRIADLQMNVRKHVSYVNDIYRGRVVNIEAAIGAAFVDFGEGRNGFLHASDVLASYGDPDWSLEKLLSTPVADEEEELEEVEGEKAEEEEEGDAETVDEAAEPSKPKPPSPRPRPERRPMRTRLPIDRLLKRGQMVVVQITKDAIGDKGPTLTTYISIPGRYLVLMPSLQRTGVSRKIDDEKERRRLKRILTSLDIPEGMGVIVRTAGVGKTKMDIKRDLDYLLLAWEDFSNRLKSGRNPAPLYQESDAAVRTMRDLYTVETEAVIVDDERVFARMVEFTKKLMPEQIERIRRHEGPRPLLQNHGVEQDFEKIFARRVELPSGGSIVIEQTEALVAIDVNSGRTREEGAEFEDIALKTNLEAVPEIARQIRLRDLGGIIVLDYIDMMRASSRRAVERATREALKEDRARSKIGRISQFGLLELTRQRLGPGLSKLVYDTCPRCRGSGRRRTASSRAQAILRRLGASLVLKGFTTVEVRTQPEVVEYLEKELAPELKALEETSGREILLQGVPEQVEDSVFHYHRADGREVRPGGRRKR
jgi:ribonuclease E